MANSVKNKTANPKKAVEKIITKKKELIKKSISEVSSIGEIPFKTYELKRNELVGIK